jgi:hypothetical protein
VSLTSYDAPGASTGPDLYVGKERFRETVCADILAGQADVMYATQRPLSLTAHTEKAASAGWRDRPSWYLVCEDDKAISPDAQRFMAERMKAVTESVSGYRVAVVQNPTLSLAGDVAATQHVTAGTCAASGW